MKVNILALLGVGVLVVALQLGTMTINMVGQAKTNGLTLCQPFSTFNGPMGIIACSDPDGEAIICEPMTAFTGAFGLVLCKADLAPPQSP